MSLYPSLEDMKVDQLMVAQQRLMPEATATVPQQLYPPQAAGDFQYGNSSGAMYPGLSEFMGLELSEAIIAANMPEYSLVPAANTNMAVTQVKYLI